MDEVIKYYVWKGNVRFTEVAFDDIGDAIQYARENKIYFQLQLMSKQTHYSKI